MKLITNKPEFYNDICEEIRLFLPREEISAEGGEDGSSLSVSLKTGESFTATAAYFVRGEVFSYTHETPYVGGSDIVEKRYAKRCVKVAIFRALRKAFPEKLIPPPSWPASARAGRSPAAARC